MHKSFLFVGCYQLFFMVASFIFEKSWVCFSKINMKVWFTGYICQYKCDGESHISIPSIYLEVPAVTRA